MSDFLLFTTKKNKFLQNCYIEKDGSYIQKENLDENEEKMKIDQTNNKTTSKKSVMLKRLENNLKF